VTVTVTAVRQRFFSWSANLAGQLIYHGRQHTSAASAAVVVGQVAVRVRRAQLCGRAPERLDNTRFIRDVHWPPRFGKSLEANYDATNARGAGKYFVLRWDFSVDVAGDAEAITKRLHGGIDTSILDFASQFLDLASQFLDLASQFLDRLDKMLKQDMAKFLRTVCQGVCDGPFESVRAPRWGETVARRAGPVDS